MKKKYTIYMAVMVIILVIMPNMSSEFDNFVKLSTELMKDSSTMIYVRTIIIIATLITIIMIIKAEK